MYFLSLVKSERVEFNVQLDIIGYFGDESFQAISYEYLFQVSLSVSLLDLIPLVSVLQVGCISSSRG